MFCQKCGKELIEGSVFCPSCGNPVQIQGEATNAESTVLQKNITNTNTAVKRSKPWYKRWWIWIIAAVIVIIASVTIIEETANEPPSLFQMAESVSPMKEFGFDATYGDLFDWLMNDQGIKLDQQQKDYNYLTFSGKVTGGDYPVSIVLAMDKISKDNPNPKIYPYAMTLNGIDVPDFNNPHGVIKDLFWAQYNKNDYKTFMDFVNWDNENAFGTFSYFLDEAQTTNESNQVEQVSPKQAIEANSAPKAPAYDVDELALRLGTRQGSLYEEGAPLYGKYEQCESISTDSEYGVKYGDLTVLGSRALDGDIVQFSTTNPKTFQKNGISLDKSYEELVAILGAPELGGPEQGIYWWTFVCDGYSLSVKSNDPTEAPYEIIIHY